MAAVPIVRGVLLESGWRHDSGLDRQGSARAREAAQAGTVTATALACVVEALVACGAVDGIGQLDCGGLDCCDEGVLMLSDADVLYIRDSSIEDLREELQYTNDLEYKRALAIELLQRRRKQDEAIEAVDR